MNRPHFTGDLEVWMQSAAMGSSPALALIDEYINFENGNPRPFYPGSSRDIECERLADRKFLFMGALPAVVVDVLQATAADDEFDLRNHVLASLRRPIDLLLDNHFFFNEVARQRNEEARATLAEATPPDILVLALQIVCCDVGAKRNFRFAQTSLPFEPLAAVARRLQQVRPAAPVCDWLRATGVPRFAALATQLAAEAVVTKAGVPTGLGVRRLRSGL